MDLENIREFDSLPKHNWKEMYHSEVDAHYQTKTILKNSVQFMARLKDQIKGYGPEIQYLRNQVQEMVNKCQDLARDLEREKEKNTENLKAIMHFENNDFSERRES